MSSLRIFLQAFLGVTLALGMIFSPFQNTGVVFSARNADEPAPSEETSSEGVVDEPVIDEPAPVEVQDAPAPPVDEENPVVEPDPLQSETTPEPESPAVTEEPPTDIIPDETTEPVVQAPAEETPEVETPESQVETQAEMVQATPEETAAVTGEQPDSDEEDQDQTTEIPSWTSGQVVVSFDPSISNEEQIARLTGLGLEIVSASPELGVFVVTVPAGLELESVSALSVMDGVQYAEPVYLASALDVLPNDPGYMYQADMNAIKAPGGWQYFTGSSNVIIAIIDSGVDMSNADLVGRLLQGWDFVNNDDDTQDDYGHGTHVTGIAAATGNNSTGMAGLDWAAKILPIKVLDNAGNGTYVNVALGIRYAVDHGANIINLSLGSTFNSPLIAEAIDYAYQHGVTVVASTGNTNSAVMYPAALPHVIAVGAVNNSGELWALSNHGAEVDLVAPGVGIFSSDIPNYRTRSGTSMAAAHVSGLASLLLGMTSLSPDQVESTMEETSRDLGTTGWDSLFGYGMIQIRDAILKLFNALFPVVRAESHDAAPTAIPWPTMTPTPTPTAMPVS